MCCEGTRTLAGGERVNMIFGSGAGARVGHALDRGSALAHPAEQLWRVRVFPRGNPSFGKTWRIGGVEGRDLCWVPTADCCGRYAYVTKMLAPAYKEPVGVTMISGTM